MTNEVMDNTKTWREEIRPLLGLSWDRAVEWALIAWLSAWIWTAWAVSNAVIFPTSGPISWIAEVVTAFGGEPSLWLVDISTWLADPQRSALMLISVVGSAVFATLSLKSYDLTGLRVLALAFAVVAVEIGGSVTPMLWIVLIAAIPFGVALGLGFVPRHDDHDEREWSFYYPPGATKDYLLRVLGLFAMPIVAPILLVVALVASYRIERKYRPSADLARVVARGLAKESQAGKTLATGDALLAAFALVAAITSTSASASGQQVAASFDRYVRARDDRR